MKYSKSLALILLFIAIPSYSHAEITKVENKKELPSTKEDSTLTKEAAGSSYERVFGIGIGSGFLFDYPGANQASFHYMFIPVYEGKVLKMNQAEGMRSDLYATKNWDVSLSYAFHFPKESKTIDVRNSMPDLNWIIQIGPQVRYHFYRTQKWLMTLQLPLRLNIETDFSGTLRTRGVIFNPGVRTRYSISKRHNLFFRFELIFSSSEFQQYFYEVSPEFATTNRPTYHAKAGIQNVLGGLIYSYQWEKWSFFISPNVYDFRLAANNDSPLHEKNFNYALLFGMVKKFSF